MKRGQVQKTPTPAERTDQTSVKATLDTVERLKAMEPDFRRFLSSVQNYQKRRAAADAAQSQMLQELSICIKDTAGDVGEELVKVQNIENMISQNSEKLTKTWMDEFIQHLERSLDTDKQGVSQFEKEYKKKTQQLLSELKKAEAWSKKAGKKGPEQLQSAIQRLTDKMNEIDEFRTVKLSEILEFERRKLCSFLSLWCHVVNVQIETFCEGQTALTKEIQAWTDVAGKLSLPDSKKQLIEETVKPERTFVEIQTAGGRASVRVQDASSYYMDSPIDFNYDESSSAPNSARYDASGGYGYDESASYGYDANNADYSGGGYDNYAEGEYDGYAILYQARALYDFVGEQSYELSFNAGDVISIISEDEDGTGWFQGELRGKTGPFPGNYVERI